MSYQVKTEDLQKVISLTLTAEQLEVIAGALEMYCIGLAEHNDPHLKYAADAQDAIIDVLEDKFGKDEDDGGYHLVIPEFEITAGGESAEYVEVEYKTNGHKGGDAGHGCYTTLSLRAGICGANISINGNEPQEIEGGDTIQITVKGDWEASGFASAFVELGEKLTGEIRKLDQCLTTNA